MFLMNLNAWNKLSDAERAVVTAEARKAEETWHEEYDRMAKEEEAELIKRGMQITEMGAEPEGQAAVGLGRGAMGSGGEEERTGGEGPARAAQEQGPDQLARPNPAAAPCIRSGASLPSCMTP